MGCLGSIHFILTNSPIFLKHLVFPLQFQKTKKDIKTQLVNGWGEVGGIFSSGYRLITKFNTFFNALSFRHHTKRRYHAYLNWANWLDVLRVIKKAWPQSYPFIWQLQTSQFIWSKLSILPKIFWNKGHEHSQLHSRWADVGGFLSPGCRVSKKFKSCNEVLFFGHLTKEGEFAISFLSPMAFPTMCFDCICRWPTKSRGEWCMYWVFWNVLDTNRIISSCPGIATNAFVPNLLAYRTTYWFASLHHLGILIWKAFLLASAGKAS